jgi:hypothetical protein
MKKDLEYYLKLPYTTLVRRCQNNEGKTCYIARVLEIPHVLGDGETAPEALDCVNLHLKMAIEGYLKDGIAVPEPKTEYSGNINIRVDPQLHANLAREAAACEMSLNKYTSLVLERRQDYQTAPAARPLKARTKRK